MSEFGRLLDDLHLAKLSFGYVGYSLGVKTIGFAMSRLDPSWLEKSMGLSKDEEELSKK